MASVELVKKTIVLVNAIIFMMACAGLGITLEYASPFEMISFISFMVLAVLSVVLSCCVGEEKYSDTLYISCALMIAAIIEVVLIIISSGHHNAREMENEAQTQFTILENGHPKGFYMIQIKYECCGLNSKYDFNPFDLPLSCCPGEGACHQSDAYPKNCLEKVAEVEESHSDTLTTLKSVTVLIFSANPVFFMLLYVKLAFGDN